MMDIQGRIKRKQKQELQEMQRILLKAAHTYQEQHQYTYTHYRSLRALLSSIARTQSKVASRNPGRQLYLQYLPVTIIERRPHKRLKPCRKSEVRTRWVKGIIRLPGGKQIMTRCSDATLRVRNLQTGQQISIWPMEQIDAKFIALSPDGKKVAIGGWDGLLRLWDIGTERVI